MYGADLDPTTLDDRRRGARGAGGPGRHAGLRDARPHPCEPDPRGRHPLPLRQRADALGHGGHPARRNTPSGPRAACRTTSCPGTVGGVPGQRDPRFPSRAGSRGPDHGGGGDDPRPGRAADDPHPRGHPAAPGSPAKVSITVVDTDGSVLGFFQNQEAPNFGIDVSAQKARTANFFSSAGAGDALRRAGLRTLRARRHRPRRQRRVHVPRGRLPGPAPVSARHREHRRGDVLQAVPQRGVEHLQHRPPARPRVPDPVQRAGPDRASARSRRRA